MNTAIAITAIIAAALVINSIVIAIRDAAHAKHHPACKYCKHDTSKENEA